MELLLEEASAAQTDVLYELSPCLQASAALKSQDNYCQQVGLHLQPGSPDTAEKQVKLNPLEIKQII